MTEVMNFFTLNLYFTNFDFQSVAVVLFFKSLNGSNEYHFWIQR